MPQKYATLANQRHWAKDIKTLSSKNCYFYMKRILALCTDRNGKFKPELEISLSHAYIALVKKVNLTKNYFLFKQFMFPTESLIMLSKLNLNNPCLGHIRQYLTIQLEIANHCDEFEWAHFLYETAHLTRLAYDHTHIIAIEVSAKEENFFDAKFAFLQLNDCPAKLKNLGYGHYIMLKACLKNDWYDYAIQVYKMANSNQLINASLLRMMIKIAVASGKYLNADIFLEELKQLQNITQDEIAQAESLHRQVVNKNLKILKKEPSTNNLFSQSIPLPGKTPAYYQFFQKNPWGVIGDNKQRLLSRPSFQKTSFFNTRPVTPLVLINDDGLFQRNRVPK